VISWLILSASLAAITSIAVWSRRPTMARGLAVIALLVVIPLSGGLLLVQRGWATPLVPYVSELPEGEIEVHGFRLIPDVAIYLMLSVDGEPRLFVLDWNAKAASQLQRAMEQGQGVKAKKRKGRAHEDDAPLEFHGKPQESLPEKQPEQSYEYQRAE
jgi:hypothetical protein